MTNKERMQTPIGLALVALAVFGFVKLTMMKPYVAKGDPAVAKIPPVVPAPEAEPSPWRQFASVNPVDDVRSQSFEVASNESDIGVPGKSAMLFVAFDDGHLRRSPRVGAGVSVNQVVDPLDYSDNEYRTAVRLRWDDEKPARQIWNRAGNHTSIYPPDERAFLVQLLHHERLALEFRFYAGTQETITFEVRGLSATLRSAGIAFEAQNAHYAAQTAARQAVDVATQKANAAALAAIPQQVLPCGAFNPSFAFSQTDYCWRPADLSGIWKFDTRDEALEYAKEHYKDHSKPFF